MIHHHQEGMKQTKQDPIEIVAKVSRYRDNIYFGPPKNEYNNKGVK